MLFDTIFISLFVTGWLICGYVPWLAWSVATRGHAGLIYLPLCLFAGVVGGMAVPTLGLSDEQLKTMPDDFLADELRRRVASAPVVFDLKFQIAEAGDPVDDPTQVWPASRRVVPVGQLVVTAVAPGAGGSCENITFNPTALPKGLDASNDPVLRARAAPYAVSLSRRLGETPR